MPAFLILGDLANGCRRPVLTCHVDKSRIMALECNRHGGGRAVPVRCHDQVGLAGPRRLPLVRILTVQKDYNVRALFDAIMDIDSISDKIMCFENSRIVN